MGYFSNGEEGRGFQAVFCDRCVHMPAEGFCPVDLLHFLWNREQIADGLTDDAAKTVADTKREALEQLVVRTDEWPGNRCLMFHERAPEPTSAQRVKQETLALCLGEVVPNA